MDKPRQKVALVAVGNLGKYMCEELLSDSRFEFLVISRQGHAWFKDQSIRVCVSDYTEDSVLSILQDFQASVLISFLQGAGRLYIELHQAWLNACIKSPTCKRFIPSEWAGNVDDFPLLPKFYAGSRQPFREILKETSEVEWTLFNCGWLMDYFLPQSKTRMPPEPNDIPIDPNAWRACIRGSGDEMQSWTFSRDVAKAVKELLVSPKWEHTTYVVGQWGTFNQAVETMQSFYNRPMKKSFQSVEDVDSADDDNLDRWIVTGASACPRDTTLRQREKYFKAIKFMDIEGLLRYAEGRDFV